MSDADDKQMTDAPRSRGVASRRIALVCLGMLAVTSTPFASGHDVATRLLGAWACESGNCPDEEISFSISAGTRTYQSWLHQRPSAIDGSWSIEHGNLSIACCAGLTYEYVVIEVTNERLRLRDAAGSDEVLMTRIHTQQ